LRTGSEAGAPVQSDQTATLTFGVVPQQAASKLAQLWSPILDDLGARTGVRIGFRTVPDIPTFERRLAAGDDITKPFVRANLLAVLARWHGQDTGSGEPPYRPSNDDRLLLVVRIERIPILLQ
jgi:hypothetical protein